MIEDAALFKYELAVVLIIKDGARYMREWLDYHLLVGVDHFYFYDNDSSDNLKEVLQRYIDAGLVEYKFFPGKSKQWAAYNDAVKNHRFECRYMAFIDDDEFLRAADHSRSIKDIVREIFEQYPDAGALTLNGFNYGSSGHETADYSIDVLERFTRRAATAQMLPKVIANPRLIDHVENPHYVNLYEGFRAINANGETNATIDRQNNKINLMPPAVDKIFYNHYVLKSKEEFVRKFSRGDVFFARAMYDMKQFNDTDAVSNEVDDAGIVEYRRARQALLRRGGEPQQSQSNRASRSIGGCSTWCCGMSCRSRSSTRPITSSSAKLMCSSHVGRSVKRLPRTVQSIKRLPQCSSVLHSEASFVRRRQDGLNFGRLCFWSTNCPPC